MPIPGAKIGSFYPPSFVCWVLLHIRLQSLCMYATHAIMHRTYIFYDSNFRRTGSKNHIRDRREEGELPCRYLQGGREYSSWFIGDVNPWQRRVQGERKGKTDCKSEIGKERRVTGVRERNGRSAAEGRETGNLLPEDLLPLCTRYRKKPLWGSTGKKVHDCPANILLKCRRVRHSRKKRTTLELAGNEETRFLYVSNLRRRVLKTRIKLLIEVFQL